MQTLWREVMRPIKLQFCGIHSFKQEAVIDFERLSAGHIFGIFGKTGSGKSTILDAMTLALYGKISRSKNKADFLNTQTKKAQVAFTFSMFVTGKSKTYEVERVFTLKEDASLKQEAQLFSVVGKNKQLLAEGATKVDAKIVEIIGFGLSEFHKCIALPQNEFSDFLKSEPNKRVEMIGNIFDLQKYGTKLWDKAKENEQTYKTQLIGVESKLEMLPVDIDAEKKILEKQEAAEQTALQQKQIALEKQEKEVQALQTHAQQIERYNQVSKELQKLGDDSAALAQTEAEVQEYIRAKEVKPILQELQAVVMALNNMQGEYTQECKTRDILQEKLAYMVSLSKEDKQKLQTEKDTLTLQMEKLRKLLQEEPEIEQAQKERMVVDQKIDVLRKDIDALQQEKEAYNLQVNTCASQQKTLTAKQQEAEKQLKAREHVLGLKQLQQEFAFIEGLEQKVSNEIDDVREQITHTVDRNKDITKRMQKETEQKQALFEKIQLKDTEDAIYDKFLEVHTQLETLRGLEQQAKVYEQEKINQEQTKQQKLQELQELQKQLVLLEQQKEGLLQKRESLKKEQQKTVKDRDAAMEYHCENLIKSKLQIGDTCPICENAVMRRPLYTSVDIASFDKALRYFDTELNMWEKDYAVILEKIATNEVQTQVAQVAVKNCDAKIAYYTRRLQEVFAAFGNTTDGKMLQKQYAEKEQTLQKAFDVYRRVEEQIENYKHVLLELAGQHGAQQSSLEQLQNLFSYITTVKAEKQFAIGAMEKQVSTDPQDNYETIENTYKEISKELENALHEKLRFMEKYTRAVTELSAMQQEFITYTAKSASLHESILAWQKEKQTYAPGEISVLMQLQKHTKRMEMLEKTEEISREKQTELENQLSGIHKTVEMLRCDVEVKQRVADKLKSDADSLAQQKGFADAQSVQKYLQDEMKMELKKAKFEDKRAKIRALKAELAQLLDVLGEDFSMEHMQQKQQAYTCAQEEVTSLHKVLAQIHMKQEELLEKEKQKNELLQAYTKAKAQWDCAKELLDCLRGKALMQFVAEEIMEKITYLANAKLQILFDGQYQLLVQDKEFFVVDNFDNGAVRSASTLSGGELFVVSLSLALAISESIAFASDRSIDFFFLDEGFGSLDKDLRDVVMQSLKRLADKHFTIGFISHVPELKEQMCTKLLVTKQNDSVGSTVYLEQGL